MRNEAVTERLRGIADVLEMKGVEYKPRAYRKAARGIDSLSEDVEDVYERGDLQEIRGVGESIAEKIAEFLETGEIEYYQRLRSEYPVDVDELTRVEGIGPKSVRTLYEELGVENLEDLKAAAEAGDVSSVEGFGAKTEENVLDHVEAAAEAEERMLIGRAFDRAHAVRQDLSDSDAFDRVTVVGSFRRSRPTIGDLDLLATADDPESAMEYFCSGDRVEEVLARGPTKSSVVGPDGLRIDLRIVDEDSYGSALVYFTGSADHNIALRTRAMDRDWKLNEYGLFAMGDGGGERLAGETEADVYETLDLDFVPPELRENTGEVPAAAAGELPSLVTADDVRGDLQVNTTAGDGDDSVADMAERADELGHDYLLVADHGPTLDGLDADAFEAQRDRIADADDAHEVTVLHGVEADVTDGGLGVPDAWCDEVDLLLAGLHRRPENPTDCYLDAVAEYPVDVLAHPLDRWIHGRDPLDVDLARLVERASEEHVALEINARPARLDLPWRDVKEYREDVQFVVSSDAHGIDELDASLGVAQARRGWCEPGDVVNTRPLDDLLDALGR